MISKGECAHTKSPLGQEYKSFPRCKNNGQSCIAKQDYETTKSEASQTPLSFKTTAKSHNLLVLRFILNMRLVGRNIKTLSAFSPLSDLWINIELLETLWNIIKSQKSISARLV
jgi:hypothetical protein